MRPIEVIQSVNAQNGHGQIDRRIGVRGVEGARFGRMLIDPHSHAESLLNICHRAGDIQQSSVGMGAGDRQTVRRSEMSDLLVIPFTGAKSLCELRRRQEFVITRAGGVIEIMKQGGQRCPTAQWKADHQVHLVGGGIGRQRLNLTCRQR